ncbi:MAG: hypothetical protein QOJ43_244 [Gaiellaceae bacterium]|jgi:uncharacterized membrane protein YdfJ with MMPL/SSD domain|nr:hypothetical protein [Gaiellaceae bacterium]
MSLYREARSGRRRRWIAVAAALLALVVAGIVVATWGGSPSAAGRLEALQDDVQPALAALELIPLHYQSPDPTTHAAAADQLEVAREAISAVEDDLRAIDPTRTNRLLASLADLERLVRTTGQTDRVERATTEAASELRSIVRLD